MRTATLGGLSGLLLLVGACGSGQIGRGPTSSTASSSQKANAPSTAATSRATTAFALADSAAAAPIALTASDGTGLRVEQLDAKIHLYGPIAMTEVHATFQNPLHTTVEGRFRITLPPRSSMTRLAMKIGGEWREADSAELGAARETYEEILHRRRDPLLVEQRREREISARVFPIVGHELKEIAVAYTTERLGDRPITFPLRGMPAIGKLDVSIIEGAMEPYALHLENERPSADVTFVPRAAAIARSGDLALVRVPVGAAGGGGGGAGAADPIGAAPIVFVVETSASKASELEATAAMIGSISEKLATAAAATRKQAIRASVIAYDQSTERLYDGDLAALTTSSITKSLASRDALGASDLALALAAAADEAKRIGATRVVFVGGGAPTVGTTEPKLLREATTKLAMSGVDRLDVLGTSALADLRVYRPLAMGGLFRRDGTVIDDATHLESSVVAKRLSMRTARASVAIEGAAWTMPSTFEGVSPDEERIVLASLPPNVSPRVKVNDVAVAVDAKDVVIAPRATLDHQVAQAKLEGLIARGERDGFDDSLKKNVIGLARQFKLASPFTALLVLESEEDRQTLRSKEASSSAPPKPRPVPVPITTPPPPPSTPTAQRLSGSHATKAVSLRAASFEVNGRVPPEVIQRIVRMQMGRFRACYEDGLRRRGFDLAGRVSVKFVIGRDGDVVNSQDGGSDLPDATTVNCVVNGFRRMSFPRPEGGIITVVYPIVFAPEGADAQKDPTPQRFGISQPCGSCRSGSGFGGAPLAEPVSPPPPIGPWSTPYANVMNLLQTQTGPRTASEKQAALKEAKDFHAHDITNPIALVAFGQALEAWGDRERAARAYGSLADLYPERAEMLRAAGVRLERMNAGDRVGLSLLRRAAIERSDQPSSHHLLGLALLRAGKYEEAFDAIAKGLVRRYELRYGGVGDLFALDLGLAAAAWTRAEPRRASAIAQRSTLLGARTQDHPMVTAMASWETDTSDLEMIVRDNANGSQSRVPISFAADGFGPEALQVMTGATKQNAIVRLHTRGSGGEILGVVDIVKHDGRGDVTVEPRPFAIMNEHVDLDLGAID